MEGYVPKKARVFTEEEMHQFIREAILPVLDLVEPAGTGDAVKRPEHCDDASENVLFLDFGGSEKVTTANGVIPNADTVGSSIKNFTGTLTFVQIVSCLMAIHLNR